MKEIKNNKLTNYEQVLLNNILNNRDGPNKPCFKHSFYSEIIKEEGKI